MAGHGSMGGTTNRGGRTCSHSSAFTRSNSASTDRPAHTSSTGASRSLRLRD